MAAERGADITTWKMVPGRETHPKFVGYKLNDRTSMSVSILVVYPRKWPEVILDTLPETNIAP